MVNYAWYWQCQFKYATNSIIYSLNRDVSIAIVKNSFGGNISSTKWKYLNPFQAKQIEFHRGYKDQS